MLRSFLKGEIGDSDMRVVQSCPPEVSSGYFIIFLFIIKESSKRKEKKKKIQLFWMTFCSLFIDFSFYSFHNYYEC